MPFTSIIPYLSPFVHRRIQLHDGHADLMHDIGVSCTGRRKEKMLVLRLNEVLVADFGLQIYFSARPPDGTCGMEYDIFAYLISPSHPVNAMVEGDDNGTSFMSTMFLNPSDITPYSSSLKRKFEGAMIRLGLKPKGPPVTSIAWPSNHPTCS